MKRKESEYAIYCNSNYGPVFGFFDICIGYNCNEENSCYIENDGTNGYECDTEYKCSLFVNTAGPEKVNVFRVLDYEVYCKNNINSCCICF